MSESNKPIDVTVVIVNWKVKDFLRRCLVSLYEQTKRLALEVIVVDNDSQDGSVEMIQKEFPQVDLIARKDNLGFGRGQNIGIRKSRGKYVFILNPDTQFIEDTLQVLYDWMEKPEHAKVGFIGPRLVYANKKIQPSVKNFPTLSSQVVILLKLHHIFSGIGSVRHYLAKDFDYTKEQPTDQLMGAAIFARGDVLRDTLHGFDEDFWLWFEDVDICKRMKEAGYAIWYTPATTLLHEEGKSFGQMVSPKKQKVFNTSLKVYARKHWGRPAAFVIALLHPISMLLSHVVAWLHIKPRSQSKV
ncbi:MAG: hypothetical protein A3F54_01425 [Candidatus Kerfeldbacteria bacterium RIFCSPHIGHO2_12_FULL_48_17]|uniref:Glycosyltransferase 2-like domain-containing protein n=1 Tax=Candidatus Kerfeldbacteria bacterium RIFCSPHIGHO2_12_FULL_48_17 TaxID=1798542 RepID=A0A1G2AXR2_9BACT|nr:MAG: hypothetical protein A3F54_01425 [Candidatus Kerfeldbacteria bacterium RIFCSPHIGHO2_12_FULL_48_17]